LVSSQEPELCLKLQDLGIDDLGFVVHGASFNDLVLRLWRQGYKAQGLELRVFQGLNLRFFVARFQVFELELVVGSWMWLLKFKIVIGT